MDRRRQSDYSWFLGYYYHSNNSRMRIQFDSTFKSEPMVQPMPIFKWIWRKFARREIVGYFHSEQDRYNFLITFFSSIKRVKSYFVLTSITHLFLWFMNIQKAEGILRILNWLSVNMTLHGFTCLVLFERKKNVVGLYFLSIQFVNFFFDLKKIIVL